MTNKDAQILVDEIKKLHQRLSDYESKFLTGIVLRLKVGRRLSDAQGKYLQTLYRRVYDSKGFQSRQFV